MSQNAKTVCAKSILLDSALEYAARGWAVLPLHSVDVNGHCTCGKADCDSSGKHPRTKNGLKNATTDPDQISEWWNAWPEANIGIRTGEASGVFVLDIDSKEAAEKLRDAGKTFSENRCWQKTGRGWQIFFCFPDFLVKNSTAKIALHVDVRGEGGYVVVPPSRHPSGSTYRWLSDVTPGPAPEWLLSDIARLQEPRPAAAAMNASHISASHDPYVAAAMQGEVAKVASAQPGTRNDTLNRAAYALGQLDRHGLSQEEAGDALVAAALSAGLTQAGAQATFASGWRAGSKNPRVISETHHQAMVPAPTDGSGAVPTPPPVFARTDAGNAEFFAELFEDQLRYDHRRKSWLVWSGQCWRYDQDGAVHRLAIEAARNRYHRAEGIADLRDRQQEAQFAIGTENSNRAAAMLRVASCLPPLAETGESWDLDPWLLGVKNGVVDLRTGTLRVGKPQDNITLATDVHYIPDAPHPRWLQFLDEIFEGDLDLTAFVQRVVGYSLTGITSEQCLFMLHGTGANGKSLFLSLLRALLGSYAYNAPFSTFELTKRSDVTNDLASLAGKRLVTASETNEGARLNEARAKAITGCDPLTARFLYSENFTFRPVAKFFLAMNHLPVVTDDSYGFWRRVRLVPFTRQFTTDADPWLEEKLTAELPGILSWAIQGCLAWQKLGLDPPSAVLGATADYKEKSDVLGEFLADCLLVEEHRSIGAADAYGAYQTWARGQGMGDREILTATAFGIKMGERFLGKKTKSRKRYLGVGLPGEPLQEVLG